MKEVITMTKGGYTVPNIGALKGQAGRSIFETVMNTPAPDRTKIRKEVEKIKLRIMAAKKNGK